MAARGLVLPEGIVTASLGGMLVVEWPNDSVWVTGTLFAVSLAFLAVNLLTVPKSDTSA